MHFFVRLLINAAALYTIAQLDIGFHIRNIPTALMGAVFLGICNALVRPIIFLLTLPLTILTLGLFTFVINALVFWLVACLTPGFSIDNFGSAFVASILLWIVSWLLNHLLAENEANRPNISLQ
jgi:putative membrane protein